MHFTHCWDKSCFVASRWSGSPRASAFIASMWPLVRRWKHPSRGRRLDPGTFQLDANELWNFHGLRVFDKEINIGCTHLSIFTLFFFFPPEANYDRKTVMNAMTKPGGKKYFCGTASDLLFFLCSFQLVTRPGAVNKSRLLAKNITCHPDLNNA